MQELAINLRRKFTGEPDAGNLHVRFDEGRGRHDGHPRASSPTLLVKWFCGGFSARLLARPRERPEIALFCLPSNAKDGKSCNRNSIP